MGVNNDFTVASSCIYMYSDLVDSYNLITPCWCVSQDGSNDLVLDWWTHRAVALIVAEAHSVLLPSHPGGRDFTSVQSSFSKVVARLLLL